MLKSSTFKALPIGLAMFSMFFGSGNVVFPLLVGKSAGSSSLLAMCGLLLTSVLVPFIGMFAMILFEGNYYDFFNRLGKVTSWIIIISIMLLIGPFAIIPRCIIISYSTLQTFIPNLNLIYFSTFSCLVLYLCTFRRSKIIDILGYYLTPVLLLSLIIIIVKGCIEPHNYSPSSLSSYQAFFFGLKEGYNTMDIFAAFMFTGVILKNIKLANRDRKISHAQMISLTLFSSAIGMFLLSAIYVGMCLVASRYSFFLQGLPTEKILSTLAMHVLGSSAGIIVCLAVSLACLTTAITLALVFSEFISSTLTMKKVSYHYCLIITLLISFFFSTLEFNGIQKFLIPILVITLPCLILFSVLNILFKLFGFSYVKLPFFVSLAFSLYFYFF